MAIITGVSGALYIIDASTAMADEATSENAPNIYQISDTAKQIWNPNSTEEGSTVTGISLSTNSLDRTYQDNGIDYFNGIFKVATTASVTSDLTISGEYVTLQQVGYISGWNISIDVDQGDITPIGTTWKELVALGKTATVTLTRYRYDTLMDHVADSDWIIMKLLETGTTTGYWCKALRTNLSYTKSVGAVDNESTSFQVSSVVARIS
jgi:hypothetical protein